MNRSTDFNGSSESRNIRRVILLMIFGNFVLSLILLLFSGRREAALLIFGIMYVVFGVLFFIIKSIKNSVGYALTSAGTAISVTAAVFMQKSGFFTGQKVSEAISGVAAKIPAISAGLVIVVIGIIITVASQFNKMIKKSRCCAEIQAVCTEVKVQFSDDGGNKLYQPFFFYEYLGQEYYSSPGFYSNLYSNVAGEKYTIRINPDWPNEIFLESAGLHSLMSIPGLVISEFGLFILTMLLFS